MHILISGSSGQLGTEIARQLSQKNKTIGIDIIPGTWTQHVTNITDRDAVDALMKNIDAIIHIASLHLAAGGEHVPVRSAHLLVAERESFPLIDLRVDWHDTPIAELRALWQRYEPESNAYLLRALDPDNPAII